MDQLHLEMPTKLSYAADDFVVHDGLRDIVDAVLNDALFEGFRLTYIVGTSRSGKTHMSIYLAATLLAKGLYPRIVEGADLSNWIKRRDGRHFSAEDVLIVDDADEYLSMVNPGSSGEFVALVEAMRVAKASIVLFSRAQMDQLPCDEHVNSRLRPGRGLELGVPDDAEIPKILVSMAKQRGMRLSERKIEYVCKRIQRDIPNLERYLVNLAYLSQALGKPIGFSLMQHAI